MQSHKVMRQMPERSGRAGRRHGEAVPNTASDETRGTLHEHPDTGSAKQLSGTGGLLEAALTRQNLQAAWKRVKANKGAAGVDGLDIEQTAQVIRQSWPDIRQALLAGSYRPSPVRKVLIPKPDGSQRELGIPTVMDRLIQQALLQVLQPLIDPTFSEHSHGFRPGRRAHDAVKAARAYVQAGKRVVVDVDLAKFFDRVNHDILIDRLIKRIDDAGVIRLIRAYLNAGIMDGGVVVDRHLGTPQGGPLSPLLANVLLDEVDKALEARSCCFARYADDCLRLRGQQEGRRTGDGVSQKTLHRLEASNQRSQERGGQRLRAQVSGLRVVDSQGQRSQMCGGLQGTGQLQGPDKAAHTPLGRAQHDASGGETAALPAGLEGVFRDGTNAQSLARAGQVAAPPIASDPTQAVEMAADDLPGTQGAGGEGKRGTASGGQQPSLVAQQ